MEKSVIKKPNPQAGQSVVELSFAIAIFVIGVATMGYLLLDSQISIRKHKETTTAQFLAKEGSVALFSIRDSHFGDLVIGEHGLVLSDAGWSLASSSDAYQQFSRSVTIADIDLEIKQFEERVDWDVTSARAGSISLSGYVTDWKQNAGDAGTLLVGVDGTQLSASSTRVSGITLQNTGSTSIVVTGAVLQWNGVAGLERISIEGTEVFSVASTSARASGEFVDIDDYAVTVGSGTHTVDAIDFTSDISGTDVIVTLIVEDGTRKHTLLSL